MAYARKEYDLRIIDLNDPARKQLSLGGVYNVLVAGSAVKQAIYANDKTASAASNPGTISGGQIRFFVDSSVASVDIVVYTTNGDAVFMQGVQPAGTVRNVVIDPRKLEQELVIPMFFNSAVETDTGFTIPANTVFVGADLIVETVDATETIDVGLDGTVTNDPNGLIAAASVATAGYVKGAGAVLDTMTGITETDCNVTYTCTAGSDAFYGFAVLKLRRMPS